MAKKKLENIVIKDEELTPTTLGTYNDKGKSPVGIIILIIIFLGIAVFLPDIQTYVNKMLGKENPIADAPDDVVTPTDNDNDDNIEDDNSSKYDLLNSTVVQTDTYKIDGININGTSISFNFTNIGSEVFEMKDYYLELYSEGTTFIRRVKVGSDSIQANTSKNYSLDMGTTEAVQFAFSQKTEDDYPEVLLSYNSDGQASLVCQKENSKYTYIFVNNVLVKAQVSSTFNDTNEVSYNETLVQYRTKASNLNFNEGITASITQLESGFTYDVSLDLDKADLTKLNDSNLFEHLASPKKVKFISEAKGFNCS